MSLSNENWRLMPPEEFARWAVGKTFRLYDGCTTAYLVQSVELPLGATRGISTTSNDLRCIETLQQVAELVEEPNELTKLREQNRILKEALINITKEENWSAYGCEWIGTKERDGDTPCDEHVSDFALEALKAAEEVEETNGNTIQLT